MIQIGPYSFPISEPFSEGHVCTGPEAKALNSLRAERLRGMIYKKIMRATGRSDALLPPATLLSLQEEVREMDERFQFASSEAKQQRRASLQDEIAEVARETALASLRTMQVAPSEAEVEQAAQHLWTDSRVIAEATRRFEINQEIARQALAELLD